MYHILHRLLIFSISTFLSISLCLNSVCNYGQPDRSTSTLSAQSIFIESKSPELKAEKIRFYKKINSLWFLSLSSLMFLAIFGIEQYYSSPGLVLFLFSIGTIFVSLLFSNPRLTLFEVSLGSLLILLNFVTLSSEFQWSYLLTTEISIWIITLSLLWNHRVKENPSPHLQIINAAHDAIIITDLNGIIEFVNPSFTKITGFEPAEAIGKTPSIFRSGTYDKNFYKSIWKTILSGKVWHDKIINRRKNGDLYTEDMTITPIFDSDGHISHFVAIKRDITSLELSLQEQEDLRKKIDDNKKLNSIAEYLAGIVHDLKNKIGGMTLLVSLLEKHWNNNLEKKEVISQLMSALNQTNQLFQKLLLNPKTQHLRMKKESLNFFWDTIMKKYKDILKFKNIDFYFDIDSNLYVNADYGALIRVFENIIDNAIYVLDRAEKKSLYINVKKDSATNTVLISIKDTGPGVDSKKVEKWFDLFHTTKPSGEGTGLGLPTAKKIIKKHKGTITAKSTIGKGTVFEVILPLASKNQKTALPTLRRTPQGHLELILTPSPQMTQSL